jgi:hypothetical protein
MQGVEAWRGGGGAVDSMKVEQQRPKGLIPCDELEDALRQSAESSIHQWT